jgi:hypothetical protein
LNDVCRVVVQTYVAPYLLHAFLQFYIFLEKLENLALKPDAV